MAQFLGPTPSRVLLVEGVDDKHVAWHVWQRIEGQPDFCIKEKRGVVQLLDSIDTEIQTSGLQAMGILVDANEDVAARWNAVKDRLAPAKVDLPDSPVPSGTIIDGRPHDGIPRVGVWLMPDNTAPGRAGGFRCEDDPRLRSGVAAGAGIHRRHTVCRAKVHPKEATACGSSRLAGGARGPAANGRRDWRTRLGN